MSGHISSTELTIDIQWYSLLDIAVAGPSQQHDTAGEVDFEMEMEEGNNLSSFSHLACPLLTNTLTEPQLEEDLPKVAEDVPQRGLGGISPGPTWEFEIGQCNLKHTKGNRTDSNR